MEPWKTKLTDSDETHIWLAGYDLTSLMATATFTDAVFLLHQGRLPNAIERQLLDAILVAVADHGPASPSAAVARLAATGNRQAPEAAVAAGVLAIGDFHGGAGFACMQMIATALKLVRCESISVSEAARRAVTGAREEGRRIPGLGHRTHTQDPRTEALFQLARANSLNGFGMEFMMELAQVVGTEIRSLPINVDGALAAVLHDLGFPPLCGKLFFIIGRIAGLSAHVLEEYTREKPMRIQVPVSYDGPTPRSRES